MFGLIVRIVVELIQNKTISCITFFKLSSNNTFFLLLKTLTSQISNIFLKKQVNLKV